MWNGYLNVLDGKKLPAGSIQALIYFSVCATADEFALTILYGVDVLSEATPVIVFLLNKRRQLFLDMFVSDIMLRCCPLIDTTMFGGRFR